MRLRTRVLYGPPVPALLPLSNDAQLLVVGARGRGHPTAVGSVAAPLAAHACCPVAVVREAGPGSPGAPVVVGVDGSTVSLAAAHVGRPNFRACSPPCHRSWRATPTT